MKNKGEKFVEAMCTSERFRFYISLNFLRIYIDERSEYKIRFESKFESKFLLQLEISNFQKEKLAFEFLLNF